MRYSTPEIGAVERTLLFLDRILADRGASNVLHLAELAGLPLATAHRQVRTLVAQGYLTRIARGRHVAGPRLLRLAREIDPLDTLKAMARPALRQLAIASKGTAHLGVMENDMVTYLVKAAPPGSRLFTEEGKQLEAYCSGIGKVLLAYLPGADRERYLASGPFIALTDRTITDPAMLRAELEVSRERGFSIDDLEVAPSVRCVAVPLFWPDGVVRAAISLTQVDRQPTPAATAKLVSALEAKAKDLVKRAFG